MDDDDTPDKDLSHKIDDFFDVRSIAAVLLGFTFVEWLKALIALMFGIEAMTMAIVWPIVFVIMVIVLANAGKKTNHDLKQRDFYRQTKELQKQHEELKRTQQELKETQEALRKERRND